MKRWMIWSSAVLVWASFVAVATAGPPSESRNVPYQEETVLSLLGGLECGNAGVELGAAFMLGDLKVPRAVIPLMAMLKSSPDEKERIVAALSLCRIGDARGVFAVKRAALFDDNDRVRATCAWFYNEYVHPGTFRISYDASPKEKN